MEGRASMKRPGGEFPLGKTSMQEKDQQKNAPSWLLTCSLGWRNVNRQKIQALFISKGRDFIHTLRDKMQGLAFMHWMASPQRGAACLKWWIAHFGSLAANRHFRGFVTSACSVRTGGTEERGYSEGYRDLGQSRRAFREC